MKNRLFLAVFCILFGLFLDSQAQTPVMPFVSPRLQFLDANGKPLANGKVCTFVAGTTTPTNTYTDSLGTSANTNPITLDSGGYATIWWPLTATKYISYSSTGADSNCPNAGVVQQTVDNISEKFLRTDQANAFSAVADPGGCTLGFFWLSTNNAGRLKWCDSTNIRVVVGVDTTDTLTNKTLTSPAITNPTITNPTITGTDSGAETFSGVKTFSAQPLNLQGGNIASVITGTCSGTATASSTLALFPLGEISALTCTAAPSGGNGVGAITTTAGTVKNLQVVCNAAGVNASSGVFTVIKNLVATALTCTVGTGFTCADTTHSFTTGAGDRIGIQFTSQIAETLANCSASIEKF